MESKGAEIVSVELAPEADWDIVPPVLIDMGERIKQRRAIVAQYAMASGSRMSGWEARRVSTAAPPMSFPMNWGCSTWP
jgi:hypothetical protein